MNIHHLVVLGFCEFQNVLTSVFGDRNDAFRIPNRFLQQTNKHLLFVKRCPRQTDGNQVVDGGDPRDSRHNNRDKCGGVPNVRWLVPMHAVSAIGVPELSKRKSIYIFRTFNR